MTEYEVVWGNQELGCTLREGGPGGYPIVGRITKSTAVAATAGVKTGHLLIAVNGVETARIGYDETVERLRRILRPAVLRFLAPSGDAPPGKAVPRDEYTLVWEDGKLGIVFTPGGRDVLNLPTVKQLTGQGKSGGIERVKIGDLLISVNSNQSSRLGYQGTVDLLKVVSKPAILRFKSSQALRQYFNVDNSASPPSQINGGAGTHQLRSSAPGPSTSPLNGSRFTEKDVYDVCWRSGGLGLTLKPNINGIPFISRKAPTADVSDGFELSNEGDELVAVNGVPPSRDFYQTMALVKSAKASGQPVVLTFRSCGLSRPNSVSSASSIDRTSVNVDQAVSGRTGSGTYTAPRLTGDNAPYDDPRRSSDRRSSGLGGSSVLSAPGSVGSFHTQAPPPPIQITAAQMAANLPPNTDAALIQILIKQQQESERRLQMYDEELRRAAADREKLAKMLMEKQEEAAVATKEYEDQIVATAENLLIQKSPGRMSMISPKRKNSSPATPQKLYQQRDPAQKELINELHAILGLPKLGDKKRCNQCDVEETEDEPLEQDESDMLWYCRKCLDEFYGTQLEMDQQQMADMEQREALARAANAEYEANKQRQEALRRAAVAAEASQKKEAEQVALQKQREAEQAHKEHLLAQIEAEKADMQRKIVEQQKMIERFQNAAKKVPQRLGDDMSEEQVVKLSSVLEKHVPYSDQEPSDSESEGEAEEGENEGDSVWL